MASNQIQLSIIVPVKNEQSSIATFLGAVLPVCESMAKHFEIVFIDDGSTDATLGLLKDEQLRHQQIRIVKLSRNFGKEAALSAGLSVSRGDAVIPMDVDMQDPPEVLPLLYKRHLEGFDSVVAVRKTRTGDSVFKRFFAASFYRLFVWTSRDQVVPNAGDFRLLSRRVVDILNEMPERTRFMKGMFSWPGFETAYVEYERPNRSAGKSQWRFSSLWNLALDGIFNHSTLQLKIWTYIGFLVALMALGYMLVIVSKTMFLGVDVPGYASLLSIVLLIGGINLMGVGILGEYVGRIFIEIKGRPLYLIDEIIEPGNKDTKSQK